MCGINGFLGTDLSSTESAQRIGSMNAALAHRGPDDEGARQFEFGTIGMARLALVDIAGGRQPIDSHDERWSIVFNGELYDYKQRRRKLSEQGFPFKTASDTEVVLAEVAVAGHSALPRLNGMFAFALVDHVDRKAILVRDRYGIKPLFYHHCASTGELVFSSELGALLTYPNLPRNLDHSSLEMLLTDRYVADPWTLFEGIRQLPAGYYLEWQNGQISIHRYFERSNRPGPVDEQVALAELDSLLGESVRAQLVADVPVGVLLSGGIDSSTVAAYAARECESVQTFTLGFEAASHDESSVARQTASHLGSDHQEIRIEDATFDEQFLERIVDHVGQPLGDASCIPTFAVSELVAGSMKAVLAGDGGDEFFGGYDHIRWAARIDRLARLKLPWNPIAKGFGMLGNRGRRYAKVFAIAAKNPEERLRRIMALWQPEELGHLLRRGANLRKSYELVFDEAKSFEPAEQAMEMLRHTFMPGAILTKVDRMSMASSLEVRVPLLDNRVTEFADRLPLHLKIRHGTGKYLLREVARPLLPDIVYQQPKRGFGIPLQRWFNERFWAIIRDAYRPGQPLAELFLDNAVDTVLDTSRGPAGASEINVATRLWVLALLAIWVDRFRVSL